MSDQSPENVFKDIKVSQLDSSALAIGPNAHATINQYTEIIVQAGNYEDKPPRPGNPPYKGLAYFTEADKDIYFGREKLSDELVERLEDGRFLTLIGASGSGKSSLLRAGIIPRLRAKNWVIHVVRPGIHPLSSLTASLLQDVLDLSLTDSVIQSMMKHPQTLEEMGNKLVARQNAERLLVAVDQFEELFTQCKDPQEQRAFVANLVHAARAGGATTVLLSIRADFYGSVSEFTELTDLVSQQQAYIKPMAEEDLVRAIAEPARLGDWKLVEGLVEQMVEDIGHEPGRLPLLSHALLETWERRQDNVMTLGGYREAGSLDGAIAHTAEETLNKLIRQDPAFENITREIFLSLTELGDGVEVTRRIASRAELTDNIETETLNTVLERLVSARLITIDKSEIEVAHEALIRRWPTLHEWVEDNRERLRFRRQLGRDAQLWQELDEDKGILYRGTRLDRAIELVDSGTVRLSGLPLTFLTASRNLAAEEASERQARRQQELEQARKLAAEQQQRAELERKRAEEQKAANSRLRLMVAGFLIIALVAVSAAGGAFYFWGRAERDGRVAESRAFAAEANQWLDRGQIDRALAMAYQAVNVTLSKNEDVTDEASVALYSALNHRDQMPIFQKFLDSHDGFVQFHPTRPLFVTVNPVFGAELWDFQGNQLAVLLREGDDLVTLVEFHPQDELALTNGSTVFDVEGKSPFDILLWDLEGNLLAVFPHNDWVSSAKFNPTQARILTIRGDSVYLWDYDGNQIAKFHHEGAVLSAEFHPEQDLVLVNSNDNKVTLWDLDGNSLAVLPHDAEVILAEFHPGQSRILTRTDENKAAFWDFEGNQLVEFSQVIATKFQDERAFFLSLDDDNNVGLRDFEGNQIVNFPHESTVISAQFHPVLDIVLTEVEGNGARTWDFDGRLLGEFTEIRSAVFHLEKPYLLALSTDGDGASLWDLFGNQLTDLTSGGEPAFSAVFHSKKPYVLVRTDSGAQLWDFETAWNTKIPQIRSVIFHPTQRLFLTVYEDFETGIHGVRLWDFEGNLIADLPHEEYVGSVEFHMTQSLFLTASAGDVRLWDFEGNLIQRLSGFEDSNSVRFHPTQVLILTVSNRNLEIRDFNGDIVTTIPHDGGLHRVEFHPTRELFLNTGGSESADFFEENKYGAQLWDMNGELLGFFPHDAQYNAKFHPSKDIILTTYLDRDNKVYGVRLWDYEGNLIADLPHENEVSWAEFHPTKDLILTSNNNYVNGEWGAWLWDLEGNLITLLESESYDPPIFHPTQELILAVQNNNESNKYGVWLWDFEGGLVVYLPHDDSISGAEFHPTQDLVITTSGYNDFTGKSGGAWLWDFEGHVIADLSDIDDTITSAEFHPTEQVLITESQGTFGFLTLRLWPYYLTYEAMLEEATPSLQILLSEEECNQYFETSASEICEQIEVSAN